MQPSTGARARSYSKFAAILEIVAMLVGANLVFWRVEAMLHFPNIGSVLRSAADGAPIQGMSVGLLLLLHLTLRGLIFFAVVFGVGWLRGYRDSFRYGLSTGGWRVSSLILFGLLAYCVGQLPTKVLAIAIRYHVIASGGGSEAYMFLNRPWEPGFWLLYVIAMCLIVPVHEEFFFRGYSQRRLEIEFGSAAAIVIGAAFFTLQHLGEYLYRLDTRNIVILLCMGFDALVVGYVYWRTRSLLPCIIMHAAGNAPLRGFQNHLIITGVIIVALAVSHRRCIGAVREFVRALGQTDLVAAGIATLLITAAMVCFEIARFVVAWPLILCGLLALLYIIRRWRRNLAGATLRTSGGEVL